jgi:hypothetical protein
MAKLMNDKGVKLSTRQVKGREIVDLSVLGGPRISLSTRNQTHMVVARKLHRHLGAILERSNG